MIFWLLAFFIQFILKECSKLLMLNINLSFVFSVLNKSAGSGAGAGLPKQHCAFNANSSFAQRMHARHRKCATRSYDFMFRRFITPLWIFLVWMDDLQFWAFFSKLLKTKQLFVNCFVQTSPWNATAGVWIKFPHLGDFEIHFHFPLFSLDLPRGLGPNWEDTPPQELNKS